MTLCSPQLCLALCNPMDCSPTGSSVHGISRQECRSGLPPPSPGDLPDPGTEPTSPVSPAFAGRFSATVPPGKSYPSDYNKVKLHEFLIL